MRLSFTPFEAYCNDHLAKRRSEHKLYVIFTCRKQKIGIQIFTSEHFECENQNLRNISLHRINFHVKRTRIQLEIHNTRECPETLKFLCQLELKSFTHIAKYDKFRS